MCLFLLSTIHTDIGAVWIVSICCPASFPSKFGHERLKKGTEKRKNEAFHEAKSGNFSDFSFLIFYGEKVHPSQKLIFLQTPLSKSGCFFVDKSNNQSCMKNTLIFSVSDTTHYERIFSSNLFLFSPRLFLSPI